MSEKVPLSIDKALELIRPGERVHTFRQAGPVMLGCDVDRDDLVDRMRRFSDTLQLGGENCCRMGHGIVLIDDEGCLFIESREDVDFASLEKSLICQQ